MRSNADFDERHKRLLRALLPHMQAVLQLSRRIAIADTGRLEAVRSFDRARQPVVMLDRSGFAVYTNEYATRVLKDADGLELKFGRFLFENVTTQTEFERAVRVAVGSVDRDIQAAPHEIRVPRRSGGSPYALVVVPLIGTSDRSLLPDGTHCLILIHDLQRTNELPLERLAWLYGLTPAEVRICESLFKVGSVDAAARDLCLTRNTVRSHLKSIYAKFGVTGRGQLMQRLANSVTFAEGYKRPTATGVTS
jgi:DNA-binding CsgD family transcriptional regulator